MLEAQYQPIDTTFDLCLFSLDKTPFLQHPKNSGSRPHTSVLHILADSGEPGSPEYIFTNFFLF
jgi:hypothetical protein